MTTENSCKMQYTPDNIDIRLQHFRLGSIINKIEGGMLTIAGDSAIYPTVRLWSKKQKSLFIESLLIKLPIPLFYFDGSNSDWIVIDGLQRLTAINEFIQNKFKLDTLEYLEYECSNLYYDDLPGYLQARILETEIVAYVINPGTPHEIKYNIFRRINETAAHLNGQEIRQLFFHKQQAGLFIKELINSSRLHELSLNKVSGRMKIQEYIMRFVAFDLLLDAYNGDMEKFLYKAMKELNELDQADLSLTKNRFMKALERSFLLFKDALFKEPLADGSWSKSWNKAIYDTCMYNMAKINDNQFYHLIIHQQPFLNEFKIEFSKGGSLHTASSHRVDTPFAIHKRFEGLEIQIQKYSQL